MGKIVRCVVAFVLVFVCALFVPAGTLALECDFHNSCYTDVVMTPLRVAFIIGMTGVWAAACSALIDVCYETLQGERD